MQDTRTNTFSMQSSFQSAKPRTFASEQVSLGCISRDGVIGGIDLHAGTRQHPNRYMNHQHPSTSKYILPPSALFVLDKTSPCYIHPNTFPKTKMVNLRLGSIAPDFKAETSAGDIEVSPVLFCLFVDIPLLVRPDRLFNLPLDICSSTSGPVMTGSCSSPTL
jgi:hypothetical protein